MAFHIDLSPLVKVITCMSHNLLYYKCFTAQNLSDQKRMTYIPSTYAKKIDNKLLGIRFVEIWSRWIIRCGQSCVGCKCSSRVFAWQPFIGRLIGKVAYRLTIVPNHLELVSSGVQRQVSVECIVPSSRGARTRYIRCGKALLVSSLVLLSSRLRFGWL